MPKPPIGNCGSGLNLTSYPGNPWIDCADACWPPGFIIHDIWTNCVEGPGICVWSVYHLWCQEIDPNSRLCWYGYSLRYSDCKDVPIAQASFANDIPRKILFEYNIIGNNAFWKPFYNNTENKPVFRFANKDTPCNIKVKINPEYFFP